MTQNTIALILRVKNILSTHGDFFNGIKEWYGNVQLCRKLVRLASPGHTNEGSRVSLIVNGHLLAGETVTVTAQAKHLTWMLTAGFLRREDNEITVALEPSSKSSLFILNAGAFQEHGFSRQVVDLSIAEPAAARHLALTKFGEAYLGAHCCCLKKGGFLTFRLHLPERTTTQFSLALAGEDAEAWWDDFQDVLKDVLERVIEKRQRLEEELQRIGRSQGGIARALQQDILDLDAYAYLHRRQIAPAFQSGPGSTLAEVIARTGDPDRLIEQIQTPMTVLPATPQVIEVPQTPPRSTSTPLSVREVEPIRTPPRTPRIPQRAAARSGSFGCLKVFLVLMVVMAGIAAGGVYALWHFVISPIIEANTVREPKVSIDTPTEGQNVGVGMPLQVWVSAEDPKGVASLALTVESLENSPVLNLPTPDKRTFPTGTTRTGTKVFTLNIKPEMLPAPKHVTLIATMVNVEGKTFTSRRTFKVGGNESTLLLHLNPADPEPGQTVNVTIYVLNVAPGAKVSYKVKGTDWYEDADTLTVNPDGTARFSVLGAAKGVRDDIEVQIQGTNVVMRVTYWF